MRCRPRPSVDLIVIWKRFADVEAKTKDCCWRARKLGLTNALFIDGASK
jgi:hypothetical protein